MEQIKKILFDYAKDAKQTDIIENKDFWDDVIVDIENVTTQEELLHIAQEYFSFESLEQVKQFKKIKLCRIGAQIT
jgi:hypothetical protein